MYKWYKMNYQIDRIGKKGLPAYASEDRIVESLSHIYHVIWFAKEIKSKGFDLFTTMEDLLDFISKN